MAFDFKLDSPMSAEVDTIDDTPTRLWEWDLANPIGGGTSGMGVLHARITVIAGRSTGHFCTRVSQVSAKIVAGTASILVTELVESESTEEPWVVTTSIDGSSLAVDVTGEADTSISWKAIVQVLYGGFAPS